MAIPVLIIGKSGSGKSCSLRNLEPDNVALINVLGKPMPFRGKFRQLVTDDYDKVYNAVAKASCDIIVIDDAGYLMTNMFMRGHRAYAGNNTYTFFSMVGDKFWDLIEKIRAIPSDKRVYVMMHEDKNDVGDVKPKTIGKMTDDKVVLEGMFTICLRCMLSNGMHIFRTHSDGMDVAKSPIGMFYSDEIDNDLAAVDKAICEYYEIGVKANET